MGLMQWIKGHDDSPVAPDPAPGAEAAIRTQSTGSAIMSGSQIGTMYVEWLRGEGYLPELVGDGKLVAFKSESRSYVLMINDQDPQYFQLVYPGFWPIESEAERLKVMKACNAATADTKVAKVYPVNDNVWVSVEMFLNEPGDFKRHFVRCMSTARSAVQKFVETMQT